MKVKHDIEVARSGWNFTILNNQIAEDERATLKDVVVLFALSYHADAQGGSCYPSYNRIAKVARVSRRSAIDAVKHLVELGYLTKETVYKGKEVAGNRYWITAPGEVEIPGGGAHSALGVVHTVHGGGAHSAPKLEPMNESHRNNISGSPEGEVFERVWKGRISGKRRDTNKAKAWKHFKARIRDGYSAEQLETAYGNYAQVCKDEGREERFVKQMQYFFSDAGNVDGFLELEDESEDQETDRVIDRVECPDCKIMVDVLESTRHFTKCPGCGLEVHEFMMDPESRKKIREWYG